MLHLELRGADPGIAETVARPIALARVMVVTNVTRRLKKPAVLAGKFGGTGWTAVPASTVGDGLGTVTAS